MKQLRTSGLCLLAALGTCAVAAASATAFSPPEIGRCVKVALGAGKFTSSSCVKEKAGGSFEWLPGAEKNKLHTTGGVGTLATVVGTTVTCKTQESGGEYNSPKTVTGVTVRFTNCESGGFHCTTAGAASGEIITNPLEGRIGFENKIKKKIAFDLFPTAADGGLYVTFNCGASLHVTVGGSVLVNILSDKMLTTLSLKYVQKLGIQKVTHFEGEPNDVLITEINNVKPEQSGITITSTQTGEEPLEANAVF